MKSPGGWWGPQDAMQLHHHHPLSPLMPTPLAPAQNRHANPLPASCLPPPPPPKTSPRTLGMVLGPSRKGSSSHPHLHRDPQVTALPWGTNALQGRVSPQ